MMAGMTPTPPREVLRVAQDFETLRCRHGLAGVPPAEIARLVAATPAVGTVAGSSPEHTRAAIAAHLGRVRPGLSNITLEAPRTASWNASVYRVRAAGQTVAVVKNFGNKWRDFLSEVTALWHLRQKPGDKLATVAMLGAGHTLLGGKPQPFLLMEAPGDEDLENLQVAADGSPAWQRYLGHVKQAGTLVAAMHGRFLPSTDTQAAQQSREAHLAQVRGMADTSLAELCARGWLTPREHARWRRHITATADAYAALPMQDLQLTVALGDCYAANFVVHRDAFALSLIDVQTSLWNMDTGHTPPAGIADAREDIGRFLEALTMRGVCLKLSQRKLRAQVRAFWRGYGQTGRVRRDDPHLALYRLRFQMVVWRAAAENRVEKVSHDEARRYLKHATRRLPPG